MAKKKADEQFRVWACILYPESLNPDFEKIINDTHVACALSPLHDRDLHDDGTLKKVHYHCMVKFDTYKRKSTAQAFFNLLGDVPNCTYVFSEYGYYHYLWHDDSSDKIIYPREAVRHFGGYLEPVEEVSRTKAEERGMELLDVYRLINDEGISSYRDLIFTLASYGKYDKIDLVTAKAYGITQYLKRAGANDGKKGRYEFKYTDIDFDDL